MWNRLVISRRSVGRAVWKQQAYWSLLLGRASKQASRSDLVEIFKIEICLLRRVVAAVNWYNTWHNTRQAQFSSVHLWWDEMRWVWLLEEKSCILILDPNLSDPIRSDRAFYISSYKIVYLISTKQFIPFHLACIVRFIGKKWTSIISSPTSQPTTPMLLARAARAWRYH